MSGGFEGTRLIVLVEESLSTVDARLRMEMHEVEDDLSWFLRHYFYQPINQITPHELGLVSHQFH